jgi:hypothetical protein
MFKGPVNPPPFKTTRHKAKVPRISLVAMYERERIRLNKLARQRKRKT